MNRAPFLALCAWLDSHAEPVISPEAANQDGWGELLPSLTAAGLLVAVPDQSTVPCPIGDVGCGLEFVHDQYETSTGARQVVRRCPKPNGCGIRRVPTTEAVAHAMSAAALKTWLRTELRLESLDSNRDEPGAERLGRLRHASGADHVWLIRAMPHWRVAAAIARIAAARGRARARVIVARPGGLGTEFTAVAAALDVDVIELADVLAVKRGDLQSLRACFPGGEVTRDDVVAMVFTHEEWRKPRPVTESELAAIRSERQTLDLFIDEELDEVWRGGELQQSTRYSTEWDVLFRAFGRRARFLADSLVDNPDRQGERLLRRARNKLDFKLADGGYALVRTVKDGDLAMYEVRPEPGIRFALVFRLRTEPTPSDL